MSYRRSIADVNADGKIKMLALDVTIA